MSEGHGGNERMQRMVDELEGRNLWGEILEMRDRQREDLEKSVWLIKGRDLPQENNQQGLMQWYMHPLLKSPCINTLAIFVQEIPPGSRSGRIHHPGAACDRSCRACRPRVPAAADPGRLDLVEMQGKH